MNDRIWLVLPGTEALISPYAVYTGSKLIESAQPFAVTMISVVVGEDLEGILRGKNDVLVLTRVSLGEQPRVDRIHFYEEELAVGEPVRNLFSDSVFITDDYSGRDRLWIELNVLEVDTDTGERQAATVAFKSLAATAGAAFPALLPYSFAASAGVTVIQSLTSVLEKNERVIKFPFSLYPGAPRPGMAPLQEGTYVVFSQPRDAIRYRLESNGLLSLAGQPAKVSYAVFNVSTETPVTPSFVLNQKMATLLTQINSGNSNSARATLDFVTSTVQQYANYQKLQRYLQLKSKAQPSDKEAALMLDIEKVEELKPFLFKS